MVDPYEKGMFKQNPYAVKRDCLGKLVVVLDGKITDRGLQLITPISRALSVGDIHELIVTDEDTAGPGREVNAIAYVGFFEVLQGTVIVTGDEIKIGKLTIGKIAGFDETHMPNHLNIVIKSEKRRTGVEMGLELEEIVLIK